MKNKKLLPFFLILLILSVFSYAQPFQINIPDPVYSLTVVYPLDLNLPKNSNITLPFDVLDPNATRLTSATTNCSFFAVNKSGAGVTAGYLSYDVPLNYWYYNLTKDNTAKTGAYSFYVHCNQSNTYYGFVSLSYYVLEDDIEIEKPNLLPITIGIITIILFYILLGIYNTVSTSRLKEQKKNFKLPLALGTSSFGMAFIQLVLLIGILFIAQAGANITSLLKINFWIILITTFGVGMLTIVSYMFDAFNWIESVENESEKWNKKEKW